MGPSALAPGAPNKPAGQRLARWLFWPLLFVLLIAILLLYVLFSPVRVIGSSMVPTLATEDRVLRTKSYGDPRRGDVVILDLAVEGAKEEDIVKRVIAVPGDTVEVRDDIALVNGQVEDTTRLVLVRGSGVYRRPLVVPEGTVYVMGDNRPDSLDSRFIGPLPIDRVLGRAVYVFSPVDRLGPVR